ncbi:hypothetical protein JCM3770_002087 [Rhodotorula araucariae]
MAALQWAPPAPRRSATGSPAPAVPDDVLSMADGELALFRALVDHRLVGPAKHWDMVGVLHRLRAYPALTASDVWTKYRELYDPATLDQVWDEQQEQLLPTPSPTPSPSPSPAPSPSPSRDPALARRIARAFFPPRDFSLLPRSSSTSEPDPAPDPEVDLAPLARAAFERGRLPAGAPRESPVPDDAPLRAVSVPLAVSSGGGGATSLRKRTTAASGAASPRKKAKGGGAGAGGVGAGGDESELSELSEDDDDDGDDDASDGADGPINAGDAASAASSPGPGGPGPTPAKGTRAGAAAAASKKAKDEADEGAAKRGTTAAVGVRRGKKVRSALYVSHY